MNVWGPHNSRSGRVGARLYRLEIVPTVSVGLEHGKALEVRIKRRRVRISRMRITAVGVSLPYLQLRSAHWLPLDVQHSTYHVQDLSRRSPGPTRQVGQIACRIRRLRYRIERPENLIRR